MATKAVTFVACEFFLADLTKRPFKRAGNLGSIESFFARGALLFTGFADTFWETLHAPLFLANDAIDHLVCKFPVLGTTVFARRVLLHFFGSLVDRILRVDG